MPENDDPETTNTLDTDKDDSTKNSLTTDADAESQSKDGPHQGRHDIGGYVPST